MIPSPKKKVRDKLGSPLRTKSEEDINFLFLNQISIVKVILTI